MNVAEKPRGLFNNKKFRLKGLGFTPERFEELDRPMKRKNELEKVRQKEKDKNKDTSPEVGFSTFK
jgi:hypothetical protein